ncbi:MAG: hypothetical protein NTV38_00095, partial [Chloroflexi bacterium]|nr:hypothetical protein [Chloroflexota bacterium]
ARLSQFCLHHRAIQVVDIRIPLVIAIDGHLPDFSQAFTRLPREFWQPPTDNPLQQEQGYGA